VSPTDTDVTTTTGGEPEDDQHPEDDARARSLTLGGSGGPGVSLGGISKGIAFLSEVREEMRKVTWPTRKMVLTESAVVIVFVVFFTTLIVSLDRFFALVFNALLFGK